VTDPSADIDDLGAPNCPTDLVPMELEGDSLAVRWWCPECGLIRL